MPKFHTTSAIVSGSICGDLVKPAVFAGKPIRIDLQIRFKCFAPSSAGKTFRDALIAELREHGTDFQNPRFSADTFIQVIRHTEPANGRYLSHVWEREIIDTPGCRDLICEDVYSHDFD